jgi:hypothetical protein
LNTTIFVGNYLRKLYFEIKNIGVKVPRFKFLELIKFLVTFVHQFRGNPIFYIKTFHFLLLIIIWSSQFREKMGVILIDRKNSNDYF